MDGHFAIGHQKIRKRKKVTLIGFFLSLILFTISFGLIENTIPANAAGGSADIVLEISSGRILKGSNIDARLPMASTTKTMTALVVIERCDPAAVVTVPKAAVGIEGSSIYLREGETLTIKELLFGLMLRSGNDAAAALAIYTGGSIEGFAEMMNNRASALGLKNTHFTNPHGLHDANHYTSAYDLARIAAEGMKNPLFREIVGTKNITISGNDEEQIRYLHNKNRILNEYSGGTGVKTGYTKVAGRCLVAASTRAGMGVVSVALNCADMFERCKSLMDYAHANYEMTELIDAAVPCGNISFEKGRTPELPLYSKESFSYPLKKNGEELSKVFVSVDAPASVPAPHKKENSLGTLEVRLENHLLFSEKLYTMEDVEKKSFWDFLRKNQ